MRFNDRQFRRDVIGMPDSHAEVFKTTAAQQQNVIVCRAVGPTCLQLLEQGYDTKGFRVHAKSCDWGPMAGFVLRDPRLSKKGAEGVSYNTDELKEAMGDARNRSGWVAETVPLKLYSARIDWLLKQKLINARMNGAASRYDGEVNKHGVNFKYSLRKEFSRDGVVWGVYVEDAGFKQAGGTGKAGDPLLAMTNPREHRSWPADDHRNALTGDYDLFTVWAVSRSTLKPGEKPGPQHYDHDGDDRRVLGGAQNWTNRKQIEHDLERYFTKGGQGTKLGNMTNRVYLICQLLNSGAGIASSSSGGRSWGPYPNRMVAWHSDETTRPFVNDLDLPLIAFPPNRDEIALESLHDFKQFIYMCVSEGIHVTLGEGWTLDPTHDKPNRLGVGYRSLVPTWKGGQWKTEDWYNK